MFIKYPSVQLANALDDTTNVITLADGQQFYGFEPGDILQVQNIANRATLEHNGFTLTATATRPSHNGWRVAIVALSGTSEVSSPQAALNLTNKTVNSDFLPGTTNGAILAYLTERLAALSVPLTVPLTSGTFSSAAYSGGAAYSSVYTAGGQDAGVEKVRIEQHHGQMVTLTRGVEITTAVSHIAGTTIRGDIDHTKLWGIQLLRVENLATATPLGTYFRRAGEV